MCVTFAVGTAIPDFTRTTSFGNWNRYAAVNDEFIDIHMDDAAAQRAGMPAAFGMGNLRVAYLHNALGAWLGDGGRILDVSVRFKALNQKGDELAASAVITEVDGDRATLELHVRNQDGAETVEGTAIVERFEGEPAVIPDPGPDAPSGNAAPGATVTQAEVDMIGTTSDPITSHPVDANDIRRWAIATHWPEPAPDRYLAGEVAPPELDPFAWHAKRPWGGPWLRGMGTGVGQRILNGGQRSRYYAPVRQGDRITAVCRLVDVVEKEMRHGPTAVMTTEQRWTNQRDELVRLGTMTTLYF